MKKYLMIICLVFSLTSMTELVNAAKVEQSPALEKSQITIDNLVGADFLNIYGLDKGDIVKVYDSKNKLLLKSKPVEGKSREHWSIKQVGTKAGTIFVTVTKKGMSESKKTSIQFKAEPKLSGIADKVQDIFIKEGVTINGHKYGFGAASGEKGVFITYDANRKVMLLGRNDNSYKLGAKALARLGHGDYETIYKMLKNFKGGYDVKVGKFYLRGGRELGVRWN